MEQRAPLRLPRALLITAVVLALAAAGHLAGGGVLPSALALAGLGVAVLGPIAWVAGRRLSLGRLLALLGAAQLGLHEAFVLLSAPAGCPPGSGHHGAHLEPGPACPGGVVLEAGHHELSGQGLAMLTGHLLAVLATAVVLVKTETAIWLVFQWWRPLFAPVRPARLPLDVLRPLVPAAQRPLLVWRGLRRDRVRGPPAVGAPCSACWV